MTTHSTTDLKPGDIVKHPEKGRGLVHRRFARNDVGVVYADKDRDGNTSYTNDLTGWERVETCTTEAARILEDYQQIASKSAGVIVRDAVVMMTPAVYEAHHGRETVRPGHVQVRVDDLDLRGWLNEPDDDNIWGDSARLAIRAAKVVAAQRTESTQPAESHTDPANTETAADSDAPDLTMGQRYRDHEDDVWEVDRGGRLVIRASDGRALFRFAYAYVEEKWGPLTLVADEKPTSATVTLYCPDCGEAITREVCPVRVENSRTPKWSLEFLRSPGVVGERSHACQPDEPTEFGARVTVTLPDGTREKWCRLGKHHPAPWLDETYEVPGEAWSLLCGRGAVTLGWDE